MLYCLVYGGSLGFGVSIGGFIGKRRRDAVSVMYLMEYELDVFIVRNIPMYGNINRFEVGQGLLSKYKQRPSFASFSTHVNLFSSTPVRNDQQDARSTQVGLHHYYY